MTCFRPRSGLLLKAETAEPPQPEGDECSILNNLLARPLNTAIKVLDE